MKKYLYNFSFTFLQIKIKKKIIFTNLQLTYNQTNKKVEKTTKKTMNIETNTVKVIGKEHPEEPFHRFSNQGAPCHLEA